jgi:sigma-B regulation protein RsbU (phosphoserine phosphatase)
MKILIAEDEPVSRRILSCTLEQLGHEVTAAADGAEAWELFHREPARIIVSDWMMPGLDGLELCKRVRDRPQTPYTFFIILTAASNTSEDYTVGMDSGIDDFLTKPLNREMLRTRLYMAQRILRYTTEIQMLQDLIPMCSYCQKVRDGADYWHRVDTYIRARTGTRFSHGVCPSCSDEQLAAFNEMLAEDGGLGADVQPPTPGET